MNAFCNAVAALVHDVRSLISLHERGAEITSGDIDTLRHDVDQVDSVTPQDTNTHEEN